LTDDLGFSDVEYNCDNSTSLCAKTPNLLALSRSQHTAIFHRFYATAATCSPTRAAILTGRNNQRDCISNALPCAHENPADTCAMGEGGALPSSEFTFAQAAKKSLLGNYQTLHLGKWHLGDLWEKNLSNMNENWPVSAPWHFGFDEWMATQAEASSSMPNCGCFPMTHSDAGPPPPAGYDNIIPYGDNCIVGGGYPSNWSYPCTNYYYPNITDDRNVTNSTLKITGDDSEFIVNIFADFAMRQIQNDNQFLAYLCLHSIHEPHPALPEYYNLYHNDPDYLGTITQMDAAIGKIMNTLDDLAITNDTMLIFTSDNGPYQGMERSNILYSTGHLRQCKHSIFEGGIRVPMMIHAPSIIYNNMNITTPAGSVDILPTIVDILSVESNNPNWIIDGISLLPILTSGESQYDLSRSKPLTFWFNESIGIIDNNWKLIYSPELGMCDGQEPYISSQNFTNQYFLFDLSTDIHELYDLKHIQIETFDRLLRQLQEFKISVTFSQQYESQCGKITS
jgi:arylsulfatase